MTKRGKRTLAIAAVALVFVGAALAIFLPKYLRPGPSHSQSLAARLASFKAQPAVGMTADLVPGTVLRPDTMTIFARPAEAFQHPEQLTPEWHPLMMTGKYEDGFSASANVSADILAYFGLSGSKAALEASRVASIVTTLQELDRADLTEMQIENAALRPEVAARVASDGGLVIVQAVLRAKSMSIAFVDARGQTAKGEMPKTGLPGELGSGGGSHSSSSEEYTQAILGYIGKVRIGGAGSDLTEESAKELAAALTQGGHPARASGNTVMVEATHASAPKIAALGKAALVKDAAVKAKLRAGDTVGATEVKEQFRVRTLPAHIETIPKWKVPAAEGTSR